MPHKLDVGVPLAALGAVPLGGARASRSAWTCARSSSATSATATSTSTCSAPTPDDERADDAVLALVLEHGGTISAEHGVGVAKARWLERARGAAEVAAMRSVKTALDPRSLLNPGKVLPAQG